ncbi:MAG: hypothetical protein FRX49_03940 [Trebouxia sp. A1-2]|nr:MAG: hypothetical protein FRX49_03940 [Trebouxia sp. A1-2]
MPLHCSKTREGGDGHADLSQPDEQVKDVGVVVDNGTSLDVGGELSLALGVESLIERQHISALDLGAAQQHLVQDLILQQAHGGPPLAHGGPAQGPLVAAVQGEDCLGGAAPPVLDAVGFVQNDAPPWARWALRGQTPQKRAQPHQEQQQQGDDSQRRKTIALAAKHSSSPALIAAGEAAPSAAASAAVAEPMTSPDCSSSTPSSPMTTSTPSEGPGTGQMGAASAACAGGFRRSLGRSVWAGLLRGLGALMGRRGGSLDMSSVRAGDHNTRQYLDSSSLYDCAAVPTMRLISTGSVSLGVFDTYCEVWDNQNTRKYLDGLPHAHFVSQDASTDLAPLLGDGPGQELLLEGQQGHQHLSRGLHLLIHLHTRTG